MQHIFFTMLLIFIYCSKQCAATEGSSPLRLLLPAINISLPMSRQVTAPPQYIVPTTAQQPDGIQTVSHTKSKKQTFISHFQHCNKKRNLLRETWRNFHEKKPHTTTLAKPGDLSR
jgi:hypothetical protein